MARKPVSIPLPARHSASREVLVPTLPFFLRDPAAEPVDTPPRLFSFESDTFLEDFLAVAAGTRPLPKLLPWRDWSEPPDAMLKTGGAAAYPTATILRREPAALEIDPVPGGAAIPDGTPAWLRKLYLPLHERFNLVAFDLVCRARGWPAGGSRPRGRSFAGWCPMPAGSAGKTGSPWTRSRAPGWNCWERTSAPPLEALPWTPPRCPPRR
jgi:hypothetical protein